MTRIRKLWTASVLAMLLSNPAAQELGPPTVQAVEAKLEALADGADPESAKTYQQVLEALGRAAEARERAERFAADAAEAPALLKALREELGNAPRQLELTADKLSLSEIASRLEQAQAELSASRAELAELEGLAEYRKKRQSEIPEQLVAVRQELSTAQEALATLPSGSEGEARRALLAARVDELEASLAALEIERDTYEARRELLPLRRDRALRRVTQGERTASFWTEKADSRRAQEGEDAARKAQEQLDEITNEFPSLEQLAKRTKALVALRTGESGLPKRISQAQEGLESTRARLEEVQDRFRAARRRISAGGLTEAMGLILRRDYEWLSSMSALKEGAAALRTKLSAAQIELIGIEEERTQVGDLGTATDRVLARLGVAEPSGDLRDAVRELLATQRESHDAVLADLTLLTSTFYEHEEATAALLAESRSYREFIEKRILWVRSAPPNPLASLVSIPGHAAQIVGAVGQSSLLTGLGKTALAKRGALIAIAALFAALLALRSILKRKRDEMGANIRSFRTDKYIYTVRALVQTLLLALPLPLAAWTLGWLLTASDVQLARAAGSALQEISCTWLVLRFLRELSAEKGVGSVHFRWPTSSVAALRKEILWYEPLGVLFGFVALALDRQGTSEWADSIGRLSFIFGMLALAIFAHRLLHAKSQMWAISPSAGKGLLGRTHVVWSLFASGVPVALALLAAAGYYYTALQFDLRLRYSFGFAIALVMVNALLLRWLFITRRRLAVRQALEARARREKEAQEAEAGPEASTAVVDADQVDIPAIDAQTRQLFKTSITLATVVGLYLIWASVLPALRGLDRVQILPQLAIVSADTDLEIEPPAYSPGAPAASAQPSLPLPGSTPPEGEPSREAEVAGKGLLASLTLADVLLGLVFVLLTSVAAKNLPALLELAVLQRLPLDGGSRYAISTIVRYLILLLGLSAVSGALGVGWQQVQWLAAALTFGLAFGLQEIFANFVSGLIILVERPIRVGDIVTVGATEGRVTQLRMRATTILDWDRREYLVPNKEFITGSVINWTLSDPVTRIVVPVGVAYGSDTAKARKLLLEAAKKNSLVLDDPAPSAIFRAFGASSLDFELRVFIPNRDLWPKVTDKLHSQIDAAFRDAGIEIAFPQRDLHIRSAKGLRGITSEPEPNAPPARDPPL